MKRFVAFLLVAVMALSLVGCAGASGERTYLDNIFDKEGYVSPNKLTLTPLSSTLASAATKTLTIGGVNISSYKIVYAENPMKATYETSPYNKVVIQDTEYDKQTADNLSELIYQMCGVSLAVVKDTDVSESTYEINIGDTNRGLKSSVSSYLTSDKSYVIKESSGKLIICGSSYGATWQAAEAFVEHCAAQSGSSISIDKSFVKSGEANMLVVGCIGDSLTKGSGSSQGNSQGNISTGNDDHRRNIASYPAALQRIAWKQMVVYNYGLGSRTMTENFLWDNANDGTLDESQAADNAWSACEYYDQCMANAENIDLVFLMLGTNDANSGRAKEAGYNYDSAHEAAFIQGCTNIVNDLKAKNGDVRVVMMNCPISYRADVESYAANYIRGYQTKAAAANGLTLLDMYTFTKTYIHKDSFPDTLHPNDEGYTMFAKGIYTMANPIIEELLGEDAQEDTTSYVTHAFVGTKPDGAPSYPVYATMAEAKTGLGLGRNNICWSYVLYVTEDITETANLGTVRASFTVEAYTPSTALASNPTIKLNVHGDTSNWMLPNNPSGNVTFKNVNVEVLEGGALYGDANSARNIFDLRDGATLTLDNVILTTYTTSGYAIALRTTTTNTVNFKNGVELLKKDANGTTVSCDKIWTIDNSTNHVINFDGAKINTTTANIFDLSTAANVTVNVKNGSELKVSSGKIFNNRGNGTFNVNVSGGSLLEATAANGVIFDARGTNAVMNITVDNSTLQTTNGQIFINQMVTDSSGAEVSKNTTFNITVKNNSILKTTNNGFIIRSRSIGGTMKAYIENSTVTTGASLVQNDKADVYIEVIIKNSKISTGTAVMFNNTGANAKFVIGIENIPEAKAVSGVSNLVKSTGSGFNGTVNISNAYITTSGNVIYNNGANATLDISIFGGSVLNSTSGAIVFNDKAITSAEVKIANATLTAGGSYVVGNTGTATADTKYEFYLYVDDSVLKTTKAAGEAIYNCAAYATMRVDILSSKDASGEWSTQILAGDGTAAAHAISNPKLANSVMEISVWGGYLEADGTDCTFLLRNAESVANIYDAEIIADSTFALHAEDSTVNIYGGYIENKTASAGTFTIRHNNDVKGTVLGGVNVYGGTVVANVGACIGAGESGTDGQVNIFGGTFIKTGAATSYGVIGHNNNGSTDKTYYIWGGTFITKDSADPQAYRLASSTSSKCLGVLNRAYSSVTPITVTEATAALCGIDWAYGDYADVCVITPNNSTLDHTGFNKINYQVTDTTTATSASTTMRILVEVRADVVNNASYENVGIAVSLTNGNPASFDGSNTQTLTLKQATLYSCIIADGERDYSTDGYYYAVFDITNIPNESFATRIYVRPYLVDADGNAHYGEAVVVRAIDAIK